MSSLFGLAEEVFSTATGGGNHNEARKTGGQEYNVPAGGYNPNEVLAHASEASDEDKGMIAQAIHHVHGNPQQHHEQVSEGDLSTYGPMIMSALSGISSSKGLDIASLVSGGLGEGGGNQLMGMVMNQVGKSFGGGGGEEKQSMMNGAAMTLTKLVAQKQLSAFIGGSNSGGLGMLEIGESLLKSKFG